MSKFHWQHIDFTDGSNPYISMKESDFKWMQNHYNLQPVANNMWLATEKRNTNKTTKKEDNNE